MLVRRVQRGEKGAAKGEKSVKIGEKGARGEKCAKGCKV